MGNLVGTGRIAEIYGYDGYMAFETNIVDLVDGNVKTVPFDLEAAGLLCKWRVRDVWRQEDVGIFLGKYEASVPGHATHLIRLFPTPCGHFRDGLSDIRENAWRLLREKDLKRRP